MSPTSFAANIRNLVLKLAVYAGGLFLLRDLWVWLIDPGQRPWGWQPVQLDPIPARLVSVPLIQWPLETILSWPLFVAIPVLGILAVAVLYFLWVAVVGVFHLLLRIGSLLMRILPSVRQRSAHLVICIDGTWNYPEQMNDGVISASNVYKFWENLKGERNTVHELADGAERVKIHEIEGKKKRQIGLYYPGVGNKASYSQLGGIIGGAFGYGAKGIMRQAYRDIIRYYRSDLDQITIVGFSRGAAIARWLASYIEQNGIPYLTLSDTVLGKPLVTILRKLKLWAPKREIKVDFLGVWDTVASFGMSKDILGIPFQKINLFKDFSVSSAVSKAVHLVAVDERRDAFVPTLMDHPKPDAEGNVKLDVVEEVWFPGVHSNVGGGFPNDGLARISLEFMVRRFRETFASRPLQAHLEKTAFGDLETNIRGRLRPSESPVYESVERKIPDDATLHKSVLRKMAKVELEYCPPNVTHLLDRLEAKKASVVHDLERIEGSLQPGQKDVLTADEVDKAKADITKRCQLSIVA